MDHKPIWTRGADGWHIIGCVDGAVPRLTDHGHAWYAAHLEAQDAPVYLTTYWRHWAGAIETPQGLNRDQVARELADYSTVMDQVSEAYYELTGGRISKPNTTAANVIEEVQRRARETHVDLLLCDLLPQLVHGTDRQAVVDYVEDLAPGAYDEHLKAQERVSRLRAANAGAH
jgi:hypothetical protein